MAVITMFVGYEAGKVTLANLAKKVSRFHMMVLFYEINFIPIRKKKTNYFRQLNITNHFTLSNSFSELKLGMFMT